MAAIPLQLPTPYDMTVANPFAPQFWIEQVDSVEPGRSETSQKYSAATIYGWVSSNPGQYYNFQNQILGWQYVNDSNVLVRRLPAFHPKFSNLYAVKVSEAKGIQYLGRGFPPGFLINEPQQQTTFYGRTLVAIEYAPPRYKVLSDASVTTGGVQKEYRRFLEYDPEVNIYTVTISALAAFKYAEGAAGNPGPPSPKNFQGEINFFEIKTTFNLTWRQVPEEYIFDSTNYEIPYPTKIPLAAGHVNSTPFMGYPIGTLLLLEPKIERYVTGSLKRLDNLPVFYCDVYLPIIHFDPPLYQLNPAAGPALPFISKGHNNKPFYKTGVPTLQYYYVSSDGTATGIPIYGYYDFNKIFEHWSTP